MTDFWQHGAVTTIHDLAGMSSEQLEERLREETKRYAIGLVLPITASDMRAAPFENIIRQLQAATFIHTIVLVLNRAPEVDDYREACRRVAPLKDRLHILWTDGPRGQELTSGLVDDGFAISQPGKGRAVWFAFGFLLADPQLRAFVLHDCDIVDYRWEMLGRLCLPMATSSLDFDYCKAYYARCTDKLYGRVARLLVAPILQSLIAIFGDDRFLRYMVGFRYPLSGEFAISSSLARSNRIPSDWGLEVGTLAEVFRNTSTKRVCQVDLAAHYEHKHQDLSLDDPTSGLMKMAHDILITLVRTLASRGHVFHSQHFVALRCAYLRAAQDAIRQFHADAVVNGLNYDRHGEEMAVEGFAKQIELAGELFRSSPSGDVAIPNWTRVLSAHPNLPEELRQMAADDAKAYGNLE
jgi:glucosyl-3-phosphoglycerate synthase